MDRKEWLKRLRATNPTPEQARDAAWAGICKGCGIRDDGSRCERCTVTKYILKLIHESPEYKAECAAILKEIEEAREPVVKPKSHITQLHMRNKLTNPFYRQGRF